MLLSVISTDSYVVKSKWRNPGLYVTHEFVRPIERDINHI